MLTIFDFRQANRPENMILSRHSLMRINERGIKISDIVNAIDSGVIIEEYPDDFPFPSCLILGFSGDRPIHVVASMSDGFIYLITAYDPDPGKWNPDFDTRRK